MSRCIEMPALTSSQSPARHVGHVLQSMHSVGERSSITSMNPDETQQPSFEAMDEAMDLTDSDSSHHGLSPL